MMRACFSAVEDMCAVSASRAGRLSSTHSTKDVPKMMVPALRKNTFAESHIVISTFLGDGKRYGGSSIVNGRRSLRRIVDLNNDAAIRAEVPPHRYSKNMATPWALRPHHRVCAETSIPTSTVNTGSRAEQVINGAVMMVAIRSRDDGSVRVAMIPGIAQANDDSIATKARPSNPAVAITRSIKNAARAM